ncbi:hypothetical protein C8J56DRAFT_1046554 [Mycena floridula]|nr:hypothetical protein C8J56DRAFT_1046554 [Mycena floridula]
MTTECKVQIVEKALECHATHPVLEPTYNPQLLSRTPSLAADISHLLQVPESSWQSHTVAKSVVRASVMNHQLRPMAPVSPPVFCTVEGTLRLRACTDANSASGDWKL